MTRTLTFVMLLAPGLAWAQVPQSGAAAPPGGAPDGVFTPAPTPSADTVPGLIGPAGAPGSIPDQVAPSGQGSGPINSTPLSTTGSGLQPPDVASPHNATRNSGSPSATPNVSP